MFVDKTFARALKYNPVIDLTNEEYKSHTEIIVDEFNKLNLSLKFNVNTITRNELVAVIYMLKVGIPHVSKGICNCSKLSDKFSFQYWLYNEVYNNKDIYTEILGNFYTDFVPEPESALFLDDYDSGDRFILSDINTTHKRSCNDYNSNEGIGILWITRHYMFKCQYDLLKSIYGDNLRIYCYNARIEDVKVIKEICSTHSISIVIAVVPDKLIVELKEKLPTSIKIVRPRLNTVADYKFVIIDKFGELSRISHSFVDGFEEIHGYTFIREPI